MKGDVTKGGSVKGGETQVVGKRRRDKGGKIKGGMMEGDRQKLVERKMFR